MRLGAESRSKLILLTADQITKSYTERILLDSVSLGISEGDKIGVIGVNGTGKSTFLKILAGVEEADSGTVTKGGGVRVGYLPQNPVFEERETVLEHTLSGVALSQREAKEFECKSILTKLGITQFDQDVQELSGGQKRRVALAAALVHEVELLVLDEPTNHIDNEMVDWLERYLARYRGALLMVTHDRYFLERVANRIVELEGGSLYSYPANYSKYLELKSQREEMALATQRKRKSLLRSELEWIQRGARARGTKARFRVERFEELDAIPDIAEEQKLELSSLSSRLGKKIIEVEEVSKSFGGRELFSHFSYNLLRGDRVGIVGPNGCGKSTLLKILCGLLPPDSGRVEIGETVRLGYFSQEAREMDPNLRAIDYIKGVAPEIDTPEGTLSASQMMERFLFDGNLQYTAIGRLSGGERRRLCLLRVLMEAPNILVLDEPTNDLDIQTLTILEDYLESFPGVVVAVSHDRYFLDKVAHHLFAFEEGVIRPYLGGYSDYLAQRPEPERPVKAAPRREDSRVRREKLKFTFKEQREYDAIDQEIACLEEQIAQTQREIECQSSDYLRLQELMTQKEELEGKLSEKMDRWVYLNDLAERIAAQNHTEK